MTLCVSCWFKERKQLSKQRDLCGNQPECDGQLCEAQQISRLGFKEVNSPAAPLHQGQLLREEEESPDDMSRVLLMMII